MATLSLDITVADENAQELLNDFATWHEFDAAEHGTKTAFVKIKVLEFIRAAIKAQKIKEAKAEARAEAVAAAESIVIS